MKRWIGLFSCLLVISFSARARADSSVVGVSDRHRFGSWEWPDMPRIAIGFGLTVNGATLRDTNAMGGTKASPTTGPSGALDGTRVVATAIEIRPRFFLFGPLYVGPNVQVGPAFRTSDADVGGMHASSAGFFVQAGGLLGLRVRPGAGRVSFGFETLVGFRAVQITATDDAQRSWTIGSTAFVLQPRLAVDLWTTAFSTVGLWAGADPLHDHDVAGGLAFALHLAPFDENSG